VFQKGKIRIMTNMAPAYIALLTPISQSQSSEDDFKTVLRKVSLVAEPTLDLFLDYHGETVL
jgi:hypothetical protein